MERVEKRRLSGVLVALGFTVLVASLLGVGLGALMLFGGKILEREAAKPPAQVRAELQKLEVPEPIIAAVVADDDSMKLPDEASDLTPTQLEAVQRAQLAKLTRKVTSKVDPEQLRDSSLTLLGASAAGAVIGWLLRSKKTLLQCAECGATVPA